MWLSKSSPKIQENVNLIPTWGYGHIQNNGQFFDYGKRFPNYLNWVIEKNGYPDEKSYYWNAFSAHITM